MAKGQLERNIIAWITVNGAHVPIYQGETREQAVKRHIDGVTKKNEQEKSAQLKNNEKQKEKLNSSGGSYADADLNKALLYNVPRAIKNNQKEYLDKATPKYLADLPRHTTIEISGNGHIMRFLKEKSGFSASSGRSNGKLYEQYANDKGDLKIYSADEVSDYLKRQLKGNATVKEKR